jgi:hypothetical protein
MATIFQAVIDAQSPYQTTGYIAPAPTSGTGTSVPSNSSTPTYSGALAPTAPAYNPLPGTIGVPTYEPYVGPGEVITGYGGGGGLQILPPSGPASPQSPPTQPFIPGTVGTGVPGVPNNPTVGSTTGYSSPSPAAAMPGASKGFDLSAIPTWGWIAIAIGVLFLLRD